MAMLGTIRYGKGGASGRYAPSSLAHLLSMENRGEETALWIRDSTHNEYQPTDFSYF